MNVTACALANAIQRAHKDYIKTCIGSIQPAIILFAFTAVLSVLFFVFDDTVD